MRVQSTKPAKNGGYIHLIGERPVGEFKKLAPKPKPEIDAEKLMDDFKDKTHPDMIEKLSLSLGVTVSSLVAMGCAWAQPHNAYAFPMVNGLGKVIGIRLRTLAGSKWAISGSCEGIFMPLTEPEQTAFVVEGPTDCAASVSIGIYPIGRPSCTGSISHTQVAINRLEIKQAVIVADNDAPILVNGKIFTPGITGAKKLANELQVPCCNLVLPAKDMREFKRLGGTKELIGSLVSSLVWHHPD